MAEITRVHSGQDHFFVSQWVVAQKQSILRS